MALVLGAFAFAACGMSTVPTQTPGTATPSPTAVALGPEGTPAPYQRTWGPIFPAEAPSGALVRIDGGAVLSRDRRSLTLTFFGDSAYRRSTPCTVDYEAWAGIVGDVLHVQVDIVSHADQATLAPSVDCIGEAHAYLFQLLLPGQFLGSAIVDASNSPIWVPPPEGVVELAPVPSGWHLLDIATSAASEPEPHELQREYVPGPGLPGRPDRYLALSQVFGGPPGHTIDTPFATIDIHGSKVAVGRNGDAGFIVNWQLNSDGMTLISYDPDLTLESFAGMANAVAIPAP